MALTAINALQAQDVITMDDGTTIVAKVLDISSTEVKYKKYSNPNGPTYTIGIGKINSITFENGEKEVFSKNAESPAGYTQSLSPVIGDNTSHLDANLISQYERLSANKYTHRAKVLKITAWTGLGIAACAAAIVPGIIDEDYATQSIIISAGAGVVWLGGFMWAASYQKKKSRELLYSSSLYRNEIFSYNGNSVYASVDMISNSLNHYSTLGMGLAITF